MTLPVLVSLVVGGIAGIALLLHLTGASRQAPLTDETARAAWARQFPDAAISSLRLSADGRAALVEDAGRAGLVWVFGADTVARPLAGAVPRETAAGLAIRLGEFDAPAVMVRLAPEDRRHWQDRIARA